MREIEIKARVADKSAVIKSLNDAGIKLSKPIKQHDVVYFVPGTKDNAPDSVWLRIRTENDSKIIFTLKKQHRGDLDSIEHEVEVSDHIEHEAEVSSANELESIIKALGFTIYSDLTKTRQKAKINDIEICLDDIEDLGTFIEAERLSDLDADGKMVENELWKALESYGINRSNAVHEGYDVMHRRLNKD